MSALKPQIRRPLCIWGVEGLHFLQLFATLHLDFIQCPLGMLFVYLLWLESLHSGIGLTSRSNCIPLTFNDLCCRQDVLLLDNEIAFNEAVIEEREQGIQEIQHQIGEVNEIFKDLAILVHEQGAMIGKSSSLFSISRQYLSFWLMSHIKYIYFCR